jgi:N-acetylglucosaminyl-diphospho-decaprenol L-rhamnosyltransferase
VTQSVAIIVVSYQSADHLERLGHAVLDQLHDKDEFVVVDNGSVDDSVAIARSLGPPVDVIATGKNLGFAGGCHIGVEATTSPLLVFLNPDSTPQPDCIRQLRDVSERRSDWAAWQAAVLTDDAHINTDGNVAHYLGIGWTGKCGWPLWQLPDSEREIGYPSGAAMVVRREVWDELNGMDPAYFMYSEDLDFGLRLWLSGHRVGVAPDARVVHSYEFSKGAYKWFWMERNRWRTVLSVYPLQLLALLMPALLATEVALLAIAARGGWLGAKLRAQAAIAKDLPWIMSRRRRVQAMRVIGPAEFASHLTASLDNPYLDTAAGNRLVQGLQAAYWHGVQRALGVPE